MSTTYLISVGYNYKAGNGVVWAELKCVIEMIRNNSDLILHETLRLFPKLTSNVKSYCDAFSPNNNDLTIKIYEDEQVVRMLASGGDGDDEPSRSLKEKTRQAFCRLVLKEMHSLDMNVNICTC